MKKALLGLWIALLVVFLLLMMNYLRTSQAIDHYYEDQMRLEDLSKLGFINPSIDHYNKGICYYSANDYVNASEEFQEALNSKHAKDETDCKIRINLALSLVKPLTPDSINSENVDEALRILYEARDVLCENGCADMDNSEWHNDEAQTLKLEIDEYIKQLEDAKEQPPDSGENDDPNNGGNSGNDSNDPSNSEDNPEDNPENDPNNGNPDNPEQEDPNQGALDELQEIQNQGTGERNQSIENGDSLYNYEYYGGKSW